MSAAQICDDVQIDPGAGPVRFVDLIRAAAARTPDALAVADGTRTLTYAALVQAVERLARQLGARGVAPGDRVMVVGENGVALAALLLAVNRAGARLVLENARRVGPEVAGIVAHCRPRAVIFVTEGSEDAARHAAGFAAEPGADPAVGSFAFVSRPESRPEPDGRGEEGGVMIYTTGTTGTPKGVILKDESLVFIATMMERLRRIGPADRVYGILPITHIMGLASVFLGTLRNGGALHLRARFAADECLDAIDALQITALQGATAMFAKLASRGRARGWRAPASLRFTAAGGCPIDLTVKRKVEDLFGTTLHNGYGLTEAAAICWTRFEDGTPDDSVGPPLPGVEVRVAAVDGGAVEAGGTGELWVRGPNVTTGYFRDPDLTARCLTEDGWFNTQDLARIGPDGRVFIVGRTKDVIIRSGFNVYPLEVETALNRHPAVAQSAVIGRAVEGNEEIVAFLELSGPGSAVPDDLGDHLRAALSPYKHPTALIVLPALPLAANGKVLKAQLQTLARDRLP
ncbi:acyl--CoA ligase [Methylobacterium sp. J-030]|uniref:class I adenylate-forming enzyme family protein n=1 Tax=Methylobacterium sp. J-030 TaxID=2836627 RepID=UPI001FBA3E12|nr:class I adenylate-forming enzyme family protein [Methylobacterium sp. J-030]MCJ2069469.1 acyl--CoA ligase [Methylobacterium sp. J-030]